MFEWLSALPQWFQIFFATLTILSFIISVLWAISRGINFSRQKWGLGMSVSVGGKQKRTKIPRHATCPDVKDVVLLINEVVKLSNEKFNLLEKFKLKSQMSYADQKLEQIRAMLLKEYIECVNEKTKSIDQGCVQIYRLVLRDSQHEIRSLLRNSFIDNGFDQISEKDFETFFDDKFSFMVSKFLEFITDNYFCTEVINHDDLDTMYKKFYHKVKDHCKDIYIRAREIGIDSNIKALAIDERIEHAIQYTLGINCTV